MSLKYGLNLKKPAPASVRKPLLDDEEDEDEAGQGEGEAEAVVEGISTFGSKTSSSLPSRKAKPGPVARAAPLRRERQEGRQDLSSVQASRGQIKAAEEVDPSIFDYDSFHDAKTTVSAAKKAAARQDAIERKPKYINNLLDAAERRKQDQLIAREKLLQREREAEGDEFADKEKFVTVAYKKQQEETRKLEAEEKMRAEEEEKKKRALGGGMQSFYRGMMDQQEQQHQEAMEAAAKLESEGLVKPSEKKIEKSDAELAAEMRAKGISVHLNEEGQVTDKRELLNAGLNVASSGNSKDQRGSDHLRSSARPAKSAFLSRNDSGKQAQRERQSRMMEEQLAEQAKRAREEEEEEREKMAKAAKTTKTDRDVNDAKARYLARKAAKEKGGG